MNSLYRLSIVISFVVCFRSIFFLVFFLKERKMNGSQKTNDVSFIYDKVMCVKLLFFEKRVTLLCLCPWMKSKDCTINESI